MDAFLVSGGDGFYQKGVPWGDFDFRSGKKGNAPVPETASDDKPDVVEKTIENKEIKTKKSDAALTFASAVQKKSVRSERKKKKAAVKKTTVIDGQGGKGVAPYGGVVGDAPGFGAGRGSGIGIGSGSGVGDIKAARYFVRLRRLFQRRLKYPEAIANQKISGRSLVRFRILKDGKLDGESVILIESSGHDVLDAQALQTVSEAVSLPPPPYGEMTIEIPIVFRVYH